MTVVTSRKPCNPYAAVLKGQLTKILTQVIKMHNRGLVEQEIVSQEAQIREPAIQQAAAQSTGWPAEQSSEHRLASR